MRLSTLEGKNRRFRIWLSRDGSMPSSRASAARVSLGSLSSLRPETVAAGTACALGGLAACGIIAMFRRGAAIGGAVLLIAAAVIMPKCLWMLRLKQCGMEELAVARERVENFKQAHGRPPTSLEELGPLPQLRIWTVDEQEREHTHPATTHVTLLNPDARPPDDGGWAYDLAQGRVSIACVGLEPKGRHTRLNEL